MTRRGSPVTSEGNIEVDPFFKTKSIFRITLIVWVALWLFFIVREDKHGQYAALRDLYGLSYESKVRYIIGAELYDMLKSCKNEMAEDATYVFNGFKEHSGEEVRARYYMWPHRQVYKYPDYIIAYKTPDNPPPGYDKCKDYPGVGFLFIKEGMAK